jgi:hypothetical protein
MEQIHNFGTVYRKLWENYNYGVVYKKLLKLENIQNMEFSMKAVGSIHNHVTVYEKLWKTYCRVRE